MTINALVIDDSRTAADLLVLVLKRLQIDARAAYGTTPAMGILKAETPNVIFVDINMPGLSGFEILSFVSREPRLMFVPVFVVTGDDHPDTAKQAITSGARAVLIKPISLESLEAALKKAGVL